MFFNYRMGLVMIKGLVIFGRWAILAALVGSAVLLTGCKPESTLVNWMESRDVNEDNVKGPMLMGKCIRIKQTQGGHCVEN